MVTENKRTDPVMTVLHTDPGFDYQQIDGRLTPVSGSTILVAEAVSLLQNRIWGSPLMNVQVKGGQFLGVGFEVADQAFEFFGKGFRPMTDIEMIHSIASSMEFGYSRQFPNIFKLQKKRE